MKIIEKRSAALPPRLSVLFMIMCLYVCCEEEAPPSRSREGESV